MIAASAIAGLIAAVHVASAASPLKVETLAGDLKAPHTLAMLPNGDALIGEKAGRILVFRDGRLHQTPLANAPKIFATQLGGLANIVVDPDFATTSEIFLSYAAGDREPWPLVVAKAKVGEGALENLQTILEIEPTNADERLWAGYLTFLGDGTLLMSIADGGDTRAKAQRLDSLLGKFIRIYKDGKVPTDNPFANASDKRPEIYTYGHRHMIGAVYDPVQGIIYANENGPYGGDEINLLKPGANYGWPLATYGMDYSGAYVSPFQEFPGTEQPILHWTPSIAPSGMTQCRSCQWPAWEGDLIVGALSGQRIMRVKVEGAKVIEQETLFADQKRRIRDVAFGPDGALYVLTDHPTNGLLLRVTPEKTQ